MDKKQELFLLELLADFKTEAAEHLQAVINGLIELEKKPAESILRQLVETVFREFHSMKGAARAVNQLEIERLCQTVESVFHVAREGNLILSQSAFDTLYKAVETLEIMVSDIDLKEKRIGANTLMRLIKRIETLLNEQPPLRETNIPDPTASFPLPESATTLQPIALPGLQAEPAGSLNPEKQGSADTVRISTSKLGILLREAEEFITVKATLGFFIKEIKKRQDQKLQQVVNEMEQFHRSMSRMVDDHLFDIKTTLLHPFSSLLEIVPRIVRDLGKFYEKEINLSIQGGEIEIDRRILDEIKDPLIHLIRNCLDHGIETSKAREEAGKPASGNLEITIRQVSGSAVEIRIHDDGAGIDKSKVIHSAIKMGIVTGETASRMTDDEIFALIFRSGVSTSPFITDISGRGLGMAIVAEKISKLDGSIALDSTSGAGTTFTITLPVTLSTFRGILVRVSRQLFIIPTNTVERAIRVYKNDIKSVESKSVILFNNENISLVSIGDVLGIQGLKIKNDPPPAIPVLILSLARKRIAFIVDEVMGEHEGMVKNLGDQLVHVRNISGATFLDNGRVIPILNIQELMESAAKTAEFNPEGEPEGEEEKSEGDQRYILVAEDSITLRILLRNIIESAGYRVKTTVDGMEAFQFLKNEKFDLLVSDVEMPRMNGFDLTAKIRGDKRLAETPVILVTALDSADDRQRRMESGANAYIIKGSFEQSNLIETIRRLI